MGFAIAALLTIAPARAADSPFASTNIDAAFVSGLAKVRQATGSVADEPGLLSTDWKPGQQLLVGMKVAEGSKRTIYFIELTTVQPPVTNSAGQPWQPMLRTNRWAWSRTNKVKFVTTNYPVRVRVFDENGRALKQGQTPMAWGMATNSLFDFCRVSLEVFGKGTNSASAGTGKSKATNAPPDERVMRAMGGGFLWMMGMFGDLQTVPTVSDVWSKAQCAFRWPNLWVLAKSVVKGFHVAMVPRAEKVSLMSGSNTTSDAYAPLYCLPLDIQCENYNLTQVQILVAPPHGAEMLFGGIRTIHARHPSKPKNEFVTQVLSTGHVNGS